MKTPRFFRQIEILPVVLTLSILTTGLAAQTSQRAEFDMPAKAEVDKLFEGFCFNKHYGGYLVNRALSDGRLRLIAEVRPKGHYPWTLEVLATPMEIEQIFREAIATTLSTELLKAYLAHCRPENLALKEALRKDELNQIIKMIPIFDTARSRQGFPVSPNPQPSVQVLTSEEETALRAYRSDAMAGQARQVLAGPTAQNVREGFFRLSNERGRHVPYVPEDYYTDRDRQAVQSLQPKK